jgi:hypothetical protein
VRGASTRFEEKLGLEGGGGVGDDAGGERVVWF